MTNWSPIECPPFPTLRLSSWNENGGTLRREDYLAAWAHPQLQGQATVSEQSGDGLFDVIVETPPELYNAPTGEQIAAYEFVKSHDAKVIEVVLESIFEEYTWTRDDYAECFTLEDFSRRMPEISAAHELIPLVALIAITVHKVWRDGYAYVGVSLGCTWDDEHGIGVMIHKDRIVSCGGSEISYLQWIAVQDASGAA